MHSDTSQNMMQDLPHYKSRYEAAKKINVYFIPGFDEARGKKVYFYAIASALLHEQMMACLRHGDIPYFAVIVEKGDGEPTTEIKNKIREYYGFDHDLHAGNDNRA